MKRKIEQSIKWLIYVTFFLPLLVLPSSYIFPFIVPKIIFFRSLVDLMAVLYTFLLFINWQEYRPKFSYLNITVFLFLLSFAISTFVGTDVYHSFWDNHERMLGLFTLLHYVMFYFVSIAILKDWKDWKIAGRFFLLGGFMVMFIGWLQTQNPELLLNQGSDRVASTLGNAIYVGNYGLFLTCLSIILFVREKNNLWRWFYGISGFFGFMGMFWSGTRGSMLGLVAGLAFALIGYIMVLKNYPKLRYSLVGIALLGVLGISLLYYFKKTSFVMNLPAVGRAVNTSYEDIKASPRWVAWQIAIESWQEKPVFGWGPNNYFYAFNKHYKSRSLDFGYTETWFDNAHNIILNTLAVQGMFGLLTYVSVFVVAVVCLVVAYRKRLVDFNFMIIGGAFVVAHFVSVITVFEDPTSYIYLMFWLAMISTISSSMVKEVDKNLISDKRISGGLVITLSIVGAFMVFIFNIQPARANQKTLSAIRTLMGDPAAGLPIAKEALEFSSPHIDDIRSDIGRSVAQSLSTSWQKVGKDKSNELLTLVATNMEKNLTLHPLDIRNQLTLSQIYQLETVINNNAIYLIKSEGVLEDALTKSPKRQQIIYNLSAVKMELNKTPEAIIMLEQTISDNPRVGESYWRLAYAYKLSGHPEKSQEIINAALNNNVRFTDQEKNIIQQFVVTSTNNNPKKK